MNILPMEDLEYLKRQPKDNINVILSGMMALMKDTNHKVDSLESQGWLQRMFYTVTGKNKLTREEIRINHDKLNAYMSEAIAELYKQQCISYDVIMSLGRQLNEIYLDHEQLKQMMGAFVAKLNEKIDSVDGFHMLCEEIKQGVYNQSTPFVDACRVLAQMDDRTLSDQRKLDIIRRSLEERNIINHQEMRLEDFLMDILNIDVRDAGKISLELGVIHNNHLANLIMIIIEQYHFLPHYDRAYMEKKKFLEDFVSYEGLKAEAILTLNEIYDDFLESKIAVKNGETPVCRFRIGSRLELAEQLYLECKFDEAFTIFKELSECGDRRAMYFLGEVYVNAYGHIAKNIKEGELWIERAAESGDILASIIKPKKSENDKKRYGFYGLVGGLDFCKELEEDIKYQKLYQLAQNGDVFAQYIVGEQYLANPNDEENMNIEDGVSWLQKAADAGFWKAVNRLGDIYYSNKFGRQDYNKALWYYKQGSEIGFSTSYYNLGYCYMNGICVNKNYSMAKQYFEKAYELGCGMSANMICVMYQKGLGVERNPEQVFVWAKRSAEMGHPTGEKNLGDCYWKGIGTCKDRDKALFWYNRASDDGYNVNWDEIRGVKKNSRTHSEYKRNSYLEAYMSESDKDESKKLYDKISANLAGIIYDIDDDTKILLRDIKEKMTDLHYDINQDVVSLKKIIKKSGLFNMSDELTYDV